MFTWLTVRFIAIASLWVIWHFYGAKAYLKYSKEVEKNGKNKRN